MNIKYFDFCTKCANRNKDGKNLSVTCYFCYKEDEKTPCNFKEYEGKEKNESKMDLFSMNYHKSILCQIVDFRDKVLINTIQQYVKEKGNIDLMLLDEKFVRTILELGLAQYYREHPEQKVEVSLEWFC